ncbi:UNVERIFIED_CONTAM: hypothetical protein Sradi_0189700 [Sesamum radiatum]|uniref:Uncharacterized protein n=1 Tax=Sesamum radiatum TaxID=300843 RepID=A0AAW2VZW9_SESRA
MVLGVKERKITLIIKEHPIIEEMEEIQTIESSSSWKGDFMNYLRDETLRDDPVKAKRIKFKAARFTIIGNNLYNRTIDGSFLKCLDEERALYVLREIWYPKDLDLRQWYSVLRKSDHGMVQRVENSKKFYSSGEPASEWTDRNNQPKNFATLKDKIEEETKRVAQYEVERNQEERAFDLTMIEEKRYAAYAKILHHKGLMMRSYNRRTKPRCFQVGDLVLKKVEVSKHVDKLDPAWEGQFKVIKVKKPGTYKLQDMEGKDLP